MPGEDARQIGMLRIFAQRSSSVFEKFEKFFENFTVPFSNSSDRDVFAWKFLLRISYLEALTTSKLQALLLGSSKLSPVSSNGCLLVKF